MGCLKRNHNNNKNKNNKNKTNNVVDDSTVTIEEDNDKLIKAASSSIVPNIAIFSLGTEEREGEEEGGENVELFPLSRTSTPQSLIQEKTYLKQKQKRQKQPLQRKRGNDKDKKSTKSRAITTETTVSTTVAATTALESRDDCNTTAAAAAAAVSYKEIIIEKGEEKNEKNSFSTKRSTSPNQRKNQSLLISNNNNSVHDDDDRDDNNNNNNKSHDNHRQDQTCEQSPKKKDVFQSSCQKGIQLQQDDDDEDIGELILGSTLSQQRQENQQQDDAAESQRENIINSNDNDNDNKKKKNRRGTSQQQQQQPKQKRHVFYTSFACCSYNRNDLSSFSDADISVAVEKMKRNNSEKESILLPSRESEDEDIQEIIALMSDEEAMNDAAAMTMTTTNVVGHFQHHRSNERLKIMNRSSSSQPSSRVARTTTTVTDKDPTSAAAVTATTTSNKCNDNHINNDNDNKMDKRVSFAKSSITKSIRRRNNNSLDDDYDRPRRGVGSAVRDHNDSNNNKIPKEVTLASQLPIPLLPTTNKMKEEQAENNGCNKSNNKNKTNHHFPITNDSQVEDGDSTKNEDKKRKVVNNTTTLPSQIEREEDTDDDNDEEDLYIQNDSFSVIPNNESSLIEESYYDQESEFSEGRLVIEESWSQHDSVNPVYGLLQNEENDDGDDDEVDQNDSENPVYGVLQNEDDENDEDDSEEEEEEEEEEEKGKGNNTEGGEKGNDNAVDDKPNKINSHGGDCCGGDCATVATPNANLIVFDTEKPVPPSQARVVTHGVVEKQEEGFDDDNNKALPMVEIKGKEKGEGATNDDSPPKKTSTQNLNRTADYTKNRANDEAPPRIKTVTTGDTISGTTTTTTTTTATTTTTSTAHAEDGIAEAVALSKQELADRRYHDGDFMGSCCFCGDLNDAVLSPTTGEDATPSTATTADHVESIEIITPSNDDDPNEMDTINNGLRAGDHYSSSNVVVFTKGEEEEEPTNDKNANQKDNEKIRRTGIACLWRRQGNLHPAEGNGDNTKSHQTKKSPQMDDCLRGNTFIDHDNEIKTKKTKDVCDLPVVSLNKTAARKMTTTKTKTAPQNNESTTKNTHITRQKTNNSKNRKKKDVWADKNTFVDYGKEKQKQNVSAASTKGSLSSKKKMNSTELYHNKREKSSPDPVVIF